MLEKIIGLFDINKDNIKCNEDTIFYKFSDPIGKTFDNAAFGIIINCDEEALYFVSCIMALIIPNNKTTYNISFRYRFIIILMSS